MLSSHPVLAPLLHILTAPSPPGWQDSPAPISSPSNLPTCCTAFVTFTAFVPLHPTLPDPFPHSPTRSPFLPFFPRSTPHPVPPSPHPHRQGGRVLHQLSRRDAQRGQSCLKGRIGGRENGPCGGGAVQGGGEVGQLNQADEGGQVVAGCHSRRQRCGKGGVGSALEQGAVGGLACSYKEMAGVDSGGSGCGSAQGCMNGWQDLRGMCSCIVRAVSSRPVLRSSKQPQ